MREPTRNSKTMRATNAIFKKWDEMNSQAVDKFLEKQIGFDIKSHILAAGQITFIHTNFDQSGDTSTKFITDIPKELAITINTTEKSVVNAYLKDAFSLRRDFRINLEHILSSEAVTLGICEKAKEKITPAALISLEKVKKKHKNALNIIENAMAYYMFSQ